MHDELEFAHSIPEDDEFAINQSAWDIDSLKDVNQVSSSFQDYAVHPPNSVMQRSWRSNIRNQSDYQRIGSMSSVTKNIAGGAENGCNSASNVDVSISLEQTATDQDELHQSLLPNGPQIEEDMQIMMEDPAIVIRGLPATTTVASLRSMFALSGQL